MEYLIKYLHILGIMVIAAMLIAEHIMLKPSLPLDSLRKLARIDGIYGAAAFVVLMAGLLMWFSVGKPASFYTGNPIFLLKVSLFVIMGLLSIYPTVFIIRAARARTATIEIPRQIILLVRMELLLLCIIPLLAVLMAKGIGLGS